MTESTWIVTEDTLKKLFRLAPLVAGLFAFAAIGSAQPVEYVKICTAFGSGYHYIPGTDICANDFTGQTKQLTPGGVWMSLLPTSNQGQWVTDPQESCGQGRLVKVGTLKPNDFKVNSFEKYQAAPVGLRLQRGEFIAKVMMSGGFYDPLQPSARNPRLSSQQFCLRFADPTYFTIDMGSAPSYPSFCGTPPIGCVSNSQILGTPAAFSFTGLGTPVVHYNTDANGKAMGAPMTCGSQLVVTTGMGTFDPTTTSDPSKPGVTIPAAGTLSTWVCIKQSDDDGR